MLSKPEQKMNQIHPIQKAPDMQQIHQTSEAGHVGFARQRAPLCLASCVQHVVQCLAH